MSADRIIFPSNEGTRAQPGRMVSTVNKVTLFEQSIQGTPHLWMKMVGLRVWNGCSIVFFTLNPHDFGDPLLVTFSQDDVWQTEKLSLDWNDEDMARYYEEVQTAALTITPATTADWQPTTLPLPLHLCHCA